MKIKNFAKFIGHEYNPNLILASGRKVSTIKWNPLIFALVLSKDVIYNFIVKETSFNL